MKPQQVTPRCWGGHPHIEEDLANRVASGLEFGKMPDAPKAAAPVLKMEPSSALQVIGKIKDTLMGILIADGSATTSAS
jgi:catalase